MSVSQNTSPFLTTSIDFFKVSEAYDYWSNFWSDLVGNFLYSFLTSKERAIRIPRNILLTILVFITGSEMVMNLFTTALFQNLAPEKKDLIVSIISGKYLPIFFSNFSCIFLNPNTFFPIWNLIILIYYIWETSRNKLQKHSVTKNCSDLSLFE